ncbi:MAG: L17 family ribosomal protein [Candidatus Peribacteraceae bacterium]|nr:L17 family ribosomal protein [Candidatus Peribacteraceae bacterium]
MMERNLLTSVLLYESIRTTKKRAQVVQPMIDKIITQAKKNVPHIAIRAINKIVTDKNASKKIMEVYCERYKNRTSGLSRIVPAGARKGDGAEAVDLVLVDAMVGMENGKWKMENKKSKVESQKSKVEKKEAPASAPNEATVSEKEESTSPKLQATSSKKKSSEKKKSTPKKK